VKKFLAWGARLDRSVQRRVYRRWPPSGPGRPNRRRIARVRTFLPFLVCFTAVACLLRVLGIRPALGPAVGA
jgi:hypothetical protein